MGLGDIIDGVFRLMRANAAALAPVMVMIALPFEALVAYAGRNSPSAFDVVSNIGSAQSQNTTGGTQALSWLGVAGLLLFGPLAGGFACRAVAMSYRGEQARTAELLKMPPGQVVALLLASFLGHILEALSFVLCVLPVLATMALLFLTAPAIVMEGLGPFAGLSRSLRLAGRHFWRVLGIMLLGSLLVVIAVSVVELVPDAVATAFSDHVRAVITAVVSTLGAGLQWALLANLAALLYLDQRVRQEGLDLAVAVMEHNPSRWPR
ncbi:MAG TPA: hypothetical protein VME46_26005 [Acidimicrobiales bacterium]|nr:hypothetical protein [Acidimicrobiales bacterium]